jgi:hypothetical protein
MGDALPGSGISPKDPAPRTKRGSADRSLGSALAYRLEDMGENWWSCRLGLHQRPARYEGAALRD